jgi:hypothetical protein
VLYTDGVTEAFNHWTKPTAERLIAEVEAHGDGSAERLWNGSAAA